MVEMAKAVSERNEVEFRSTLAREYIVPTT
nr:MAG TPA: hypothetical protein [Caudoviricetes sp.]